MAPRGFSFNRLVGISSAKGRISRAIGVPLSKSGRRKKGNRILAGCGCLFLFLILVLVIVGPGSILDRDDTSEERTAQEQAPAGSGELSERE
jgi:hypothetical protein